MCSRNDDPSQHDPRRPYPNAVKVAPGTWLHHNLYLRGSGPEPETPQPDRIEGDGFIIDLTLNIYIEFGGSE